jgi:hypothetical protein
MDKPTMITKMIREELNDMLSEANGSNNKFNFTTRFIKGNSKRDIEFYNYETFTTEFDTNIINYDITINWSAYFWLNDFGIENFILNGENVGGVIMLEMRDKISDEVKQETQKNIQDFNWKFIADEASLVKGGSLYVHHLIFDFKEKTCTIVFTN